MNGGMVRCINLLHQLSRSCEITAIMHQGVLEFQKAVAEYPALANCKVISTGDQKEVKDVFSFFPGKIASALRYRYWTRNPFGSANLHVLKIYPVLKKLLSSNSFDFIILEDILLMSLVPIIRVKQPGAKIIYDAYNVNSRLMKAAVTDATSEKKYQSMLKDESKLFKQVDASFVCSEVDLKELSELNQNRMHCTVIPNGVGVPDQWSYPDVTMHENEILFCGSLDYAPNREGLLWFCNEVLPKVLAYKSNVKLSVVGKGDPGNELLISLKHPAINYHGMVQTVIPYYKQASLAIVPLLSGSGTRLKVLEAMGFGIPVLSTTTGAEGIAYTNNENIVIADGSENFAEMIVQLISDRNFATGISKNAYQLVQKNYDWNIVGEKMKNFFLQSLGS